ncbi:unnamed protein product [Ambrosiozyma monospora]|uniref:Unnamed protein product n=1 Tax=Ambrosiozyma monospora TaxID=43982 RepID=A0A9W6YW05_AMBMO|nr:unnamed protein product [Ambrosiozyma monospora]
MIYNFYTEDILYFGNTPQYGGNTFYTIVYAFLFVIHTILAIVTREIVFGSAFVIGCILEMCGFCGRVDAHFHDTNLADYMVSLVGTILGPVFFLAGIYDIFGHIMKLYNSEFCPIKNVSDYRLTFAIMDFISFIILLAGCGVAGDGGENRSVVGAHCIIAGLVIQLVILIIFTGFVGAFFFNMYNHSSKTSLKLDDRFSKIRDTPYTGSVVFSILISIFLYYIRTIYRIVQMSGSFNSKLHRNETLILVLDAAMVAISVILLTIFYPGLQTKKMRDVKKPQETKPEDGEAEFKLDDEPASKTSITAV